jgi:hypothetical protein
MSRGAFASGLCVSAKELGDLRSRALLLLPSPPAAEDGEASIGECACIDVRTSCHAMRSETEGDATDPPPPTHSRGSSPPVERAESEDGSSGTETCRGVCASRGAEEMCAKPSGNSSAGGVGSWSGERPSSLTLAMLSPQRICCCCELDLDECPLRCPGLLALPTGEAGLASEIAIGRKDSAGPVRKLLGESERCTCGGTDASVGSWSGVPRITIGEAGIGDRAG